MQDLCALKSQGEEGRVPLPLCLSPGLYLSSPHKNLSPADHFLCDSFQTSQLCLSLAVFLCSKPAGCFSSCNIEWLCQSGFPFCPYVPAMAVGWKIFCFVLFSPSFFRSYFVCGFVVVVVQFTHSRTVMLDHPSPQQLSDPPTRRQSERTGNKQCMREISKCIRRIVLLQRQYWGPPGAHYCSRWDKAGRELLSWLPGDGENGKGKIK